MMESRDKILASIRVNLPRLQRSLPSSPLYDDRPPASLVSAFKSSLEHMGGVLLDAPASGVFLADVRDRVSATKIVCSMIPEIAGNRSISVGALPRQLADIDFAIVRASFGVAETGSVLLSDADLGINALGYLAQHLVVLLDPADIVANIHQAYRRPEFCNSRYASFHTGPSATADIEGVLIHGAQGVRSLFVLLLAKKQPETADVVAP
jgi:L-lactate dehydrogenase complex protein LldG